MNHNADSDIDDDDDDDVIWQWQSDLLHDWFQSNVHHPYLGKPSSSAKHHKNNQDKHDDNNKDDDDEDDETSDNGEKEIVKIWRQAKLTKQQFKQWVSNERFVLRIFTHLTRNFSHSVFLMDCC